MKLRCLPVLIHDINVMIQVIVSKSRLSALSGSLAELGQAALGGKA